MSYPKKTSLNIVKVDRKYVFIVMGASMRLISVVPWRTLSTAIAAVVSLTIDISDKVDREKGKIGEKDNALEFARNDAEILFGLGL